MAATDTGATKKSNGAVKPPSHEAMEMAQAFRGSKSPKVSRRTLIGLAAAFGRKK